MTITMHFNTILSLNLCCGHLFLRIFPRDGDHGVFPNVPFYGGGHPSAHGVYGVRVYHVYHGGRDPKTK